MLLSAVFSALLGSAAAQTCSGPAFGFIINPTIPAPSAIFPAGDYSDSVFQFRLARAPTTTVTVNVATSHSVTVVNPTTLTFSPTNFDIAQPVQLRHKQNMTFDLVVPTTVSFTPLNAGGITIPAVSYTINITSTSTGIGCDANINPRCLD